MYRLFFLVFPFVAQVNALDADIVCITGDFVDGTVESRRADLEPLKDLKSRQGVFGWAGNHEYYSGYRTAAPAGGWTFLWPGWGTRGICADCTARGTSRST